jgi:hypothetical protein
MQSQLKCQGTILQLAEELTRSLIKFQGMSLLVPSLLKNLNESWIKCQGTTSQLAEKICSSSVLCLDAEFLLLQTGFVAVCLMSGGPICGFLAHLSPGLTLPESVFACAAGCGL